MSGHDKVLWGSIHYKADSGGAPLDARTKSNILELLDSGYPSTADSLTKVNDSILIELHSTPPSEGSTTSSEDDDEWEDAEPDVEDLTFRSLIDQKPFKDLGSMCKYDRETWNLDLVAIKKDLDLDFLQSIKFVNYVRSEAQKGVKSIQQPISKDAFASDEYLQPVLEDDAVLFSIEDLEGGPSADVDNENQPTKDLQDDSAQAYIARIKQLETALQLSRESFLEERTAAEKEAPSVPRNQRQREVHDRFYFDSYATRDIHEEMLKDTARTDAYRDFIYENKQLFDGKTVLDVGCGTGILSLMCARAGAKQVFAVDNSGIIDKAREIAFVNGMQDRITFIRGMVEEITLPVKSVDIIVSEWMGYALLYEAMLDSVLSARDKWLSPGGLMIPSEISLHMTLLADPELVVEKSDFWSDVYGFDMSAMRHGVFEGAMVECATKSVIPSDMSSSGGSNKVLHLDLHSAKTDDLTFRKPFELRLNREVDALDGFVVWFDAIFGRSEAGHHLVTLSTGPLAKRTHWQQVKLVIDHGGKSAARLSAGDLVTGTIEYLRLSDEHRNLEISMQWEVEARNESGTQNWKIDY